MAEPLPPPDHTTDRSSGASSYDSATSDTTYATDTRTSRGISGSRHATSVLLALVLVPAAYVLLDYTFLEALGNSESLLEEGQHSTEVMVTMGIAVACFFAAAATGRLSALGPLVAGLVWGGALTVWVLLDFASYADAVRDVPNLYDDFGVGLLAIGFAVYPAVTGLLLGGAVAGRWRGSR